MSSPYSKDNVRSGLLHYFLGRGMSGLAGFAVIILLVRFMDVENYASYTALSGLIAFAGILAGLGLERAISRYVPEGRINYTAHQLGRFIWVMTFVRVSTSIIISVLIYLIWDFIAKLFGIVDLGRFPLSLALFIIAETLFQYFSAVLQALMLQKMLTRIMVIQWAGRLLMLVFAIFIYSDITLEHALWIMTIPEALGVVVFILLLKNYLKELSATQVHEAIKTHDEAWPSWNGVMKFSIHNYGFNLIAAPPQGYFMKMLAATMLPANMVAAYGFFLSVAERLRQYIPLHLFYNLLEPLIIAKYIQDKNFQTLASRCQLLYKTNLLLLIPAIALVGVAGPYLISMMTNGKYQEYTWILALVIIQLTIGSHVVLLQLILNSVNASYLLIRGSIFALIGMTAFGLLVGHLDNKYIICAPIFFSICCNFYIVRNLIKQGYAYHVPWRSIAPIVTAGFVAFALASILLFVTDTDFNAFLTTVMSGVAVMLIYLPVLWVLGAIKPDEIKTIKSIILSKR